MLLKKPYLGIFLHQKMHNLMVFLIIKLLSGFKVLKRGNGPFYLDNLSFIRFFYTSTNFTFHSITFERLTLRRSNKDRSKALGMTNKMVPFTSLKISVFGYKR